MIEPSHLAVSGKPQHSISSSQSGAIRTDTEGSLRHYRLHVYGRAG
jgi:hypothetical protein